MKSSFHTPTNVHPAPHVPPARLRPRLNAIAAAVRLALLAAPMLVAAQTTTLPRVNVSGSAAAPPLTAVTEDIAASPANVTVLGRKELDAKTITTYGDIFRGLTGVYVNEYGQGLVAYEIKFRGFTSGHGRDVAASLDGVPLNVTGSQHTNGYMDLATLIPELVDRVEVVRGPFSPYAGNHAVAGSVQMFTDRDAQSSVKATVDSFGRVRIVPIYATAAGPGNLLLALDATHGSAYTRQSNIDRVNLFTRYVLPLTNASAAVRFQSYRADAEAPGYLDLARIESGAIDRRDALNKGIGDTKRQQNLVFNYRSDDADGKLGDRFGWTSGLSANAYVVRDKRERFTNFDISLPSNSGTNIGAERDRLNQTGFDVRKVQSFKLGGWPSQLALGAQFNRERINALNFSADANRNALAPSASTPDTVGIDRNVLTTTKALYTQLQVQPLVALKLTAGLRYDHLDFTVNLRPQDDTYAAAVAAGLGPNVNASKGRVSPKLGVALNLFDAPNNSVDAYANYALGLKSPYAFSDFFSNLGSSSVVPDLALSTLRSAELGLQGGSKDGAMKWRAGVWDTRQEKEGQRTDAGVFLDFGTTTRRGFDVEGSVALSPSTRVFANYSAVRARSLTSAAGQNYLTNVPEWSGALGVQTAFISGAHRFDVSVEDSVVGPQAITADNTARGKTYNRLTARAAYSNAERKGASAFVSLVGYDKQYEETRFDFGGGAVGVSPRPKFEATVGVQFPFNF